MTRSAPAGALLAGLLLVAAGCAPAATVAPSPTPTAAPSANAADAAADEARHWERVRANRTATDADAAFITGMLAHHTQALVMAAWAPTNGAGAEVGRLAARIDNAQRDEIALMQRWLERRGRPVPMVHEMNGRLMVHGADHDHHDMPGMLTDAQLDELEAARGLDFDRLFLRYMIQHHSGAVTMVDDLFAIDGAAQDTETYRLASDIQVDQRTEIARMQQMLDALPAGR